jgi:hypothetical protein
MCSVSSRVVTSTRISGLILSATGQQYDTAGGYGPAVMTRFMARVTRSRVQVPCPDRAKKFGARSCSRYAASRGGG